MTLNKLGVLHHKDQRMKEARETYEEALKIQRQLARENPATYEPDVAMTLNNLGVLHRTENRKKEAREAYEEALEIYQRFAKTAPSQFRPRVERVQRILRSLGT